MNDSNREDRRYRLTFGVIAAAVSAYTLLQGLVVPAVSTLQNEFHTDQTSASWVITSYLMAASISTPLLGRLGDILGKQRVMLGALGVVVLACVGAALAPSIGWLIVARVFQGIGGGILALSFGIIREQFPSGKVAFAVSFVSSLGAVGYGAGIVLAGPIISGLGYRWLFWIPMIVAAASAGALLLVPDRDPVRTPARISFTPAVLLSGWLVCLLLAISEGSSWGWTSPAVLALLVGFVVFSPGWLWAERRAASPLIDLDLFRIRGVWTTSVVVMCIGFGTYCYYAFLPQFVSAPAASGYGLRVDPAASGKYVLPAMVFTFIAGMFVARFVRAFGERRVIVAGAALMSIALTLVALFHDHAWQLLVFTGIHGVGSGLTFSSIAAVVLGSVPATQTGVASGMSANIRTIGGCIGTAALAGIISAHIGAGGIPREAGYTTGFAVIAGVLALAAVFALLIPDSRGLPRVVAEHATEYAELSVLPLPAVPSTASRPDGRVATDTSYHLKEQL